MYIFIKKRPWGGVKRTWEGVGGKTLFFICIDEKKVETLVVIDHEIQRLIEKFKVEQDAEPTKKNIDRKVNLINSEPLAKILEHMATLIKSGAMIYRWWKTLDKLFVKPLKKSTYR